MEQLEGFLNEQTFLMLTYVEEEEYELAADVRDDIDEKIDNVAKVIKKYDMTKLTEEELIHQLNNRKNIYMITWQEILTGNQEFNI